MGVSTGRLITSRPAERRVADAPERAPPSRRTVLLDSIALTATADVVDGHLGCIVHESLVTGEFFVKGEDAAG